jgi:hypothetical protein
VPGKPSFLDLCSDREVTPLFSPQMLINATPPRLSPLSSDREESELGTPLLGNTAGCHAVQLAAAGAVIVYPRTQGGPPDIQQFPAYSAHIRLGTPYASELTQC